MTASADIELLMSCFRSAADEDQVLHSASSATDLSGQEWICPNADGDVISTSSTAHSRKRREPVNKRLKDEKPKSKGHFRVNQVSGVAVITAGL